jgi:hypothetical protein
MALLSDCGVAHRGRVCLISIIACFPDMHWVLDEQIAEGDASVEVAEIFAAQCTRLAALPVGLDVTTELNSIFSLLRWILDVNY